VNYPIKTIILSVIAVDTGQLLLKNGMSNINLAPGSYVTGMISAFSSPFVIAGLIIIIMSSMLWISVLSKSDISFAYPMLSMGFIFVSIVSLFLFNEKITLIRWAGIFFISSGVFMMTRS
jgi:drug/metabolite transporter (DMT)-like permease